LNYINIIFYFKCKCTAISTVIISLLIPPSCYYLITTSFFRYRGRKLRVQRDRNQRFWISQGVFRWQSIGSVVVAVSTAFSLAYFYHYINNNIDQEEQKESTSSSSQVNLKIQSLSLHVLFYWISKFNDLLSIFRSLEDIDYGINS
jgi:magnesium-transporting ATPase (P-type)